MDRKLKYLEDSTGMSNMVAYQIKCNECNKLLLKAPTTIYGYAMYFAESHNMETGHTANIVEV